MSVPTREVIQGKLAKERSRLVDFYRSLDPAVLTTACTESEHPDGDPWAPKDHLAHLAMIERQFQGMIERTLEGHERPVGISGKNMEEVLGTVHRLNQANVDEHRSDDLSVLLADIEAARADTLALLARISDEDLARPVPGAPWADGTIGGVLITAGYHDQQHVVWVQEALASTP
jgi:hypothetical protein